MNPSISVSVLLFSFFLFLFLHLTKPNKSKNSNLPPCPPKLPILGNLHQLGAQPHLSLAKLARKYGPVMHVQLGRVPALVISSATAAEEILKRHDEAFSSRPQSGIANRLVYGGKDVAFAPYGDHWRQMKKIIMIHLLNTKRVQSFQYVREEEVAKIQNLSSSGGLVDFSEAFGVLSNDIICSVVFGRKFSREEGENYFHLMLAAFLDLLGTFSVGEFIPSLAWVSRLNGLNARVKRNNEEFDAFFDRVLDEHIESRRDGGEGGNFLDVLLALQNDVSIGITLSRDSIKKH